MSKFAAKIIQSPSSRIKDPWGSGKYGASRRHRTHKGLDIKTKVREKIFAPISGSIMREAIPYAKDPSYRGILLRGNGQWTGYELKIFYMKGILCGGVNAGQHIGFAQDLTRKYPKITNHIHLEIKRNGMQINPFELWQMSF